MVTEPGEEKRLKILDATLKLISEKGFHGTAMSKVAKEAGVSAGIIYHYFENKDELILELYKAQKRKMADAIYEGLDLAQPLSAQVRYIVEKCFRYHLTQPGITSFMQQFGTSPYFTCQVETEMRVHTKGITDIMDRAQKEMIIKDLPGPVFGTLIIDVASSLAQKQAVGLIELTDELVDDIVDAVWAAIRY